MAYELYWISGSPNGWCAQLAMEIKRLEYVSHRLDPSKGEHKTAEVLALNPRGKIPILRDGDFAVFESVAIVAYLEAKHPEPALFGTGPEETGRIWQRIFEITNYGRDVLENGVVRPLFRGQADENGSKIKASAADVHKVLEWVSGILGHEAYLAGGSVSAADIVTMPILQSLFRAGGREDAIGLELGFDDVAATYPNIAAWIGRLEALPGYQKVYPPHWR